MQFVRVLADWILHYFPLASGLWPRPYPWPWPRSCWSY